HAWWIFFFQAEDGIRDRNVTGVQTCALPICLRLVLIISSTSFPQDQAAKSIHTCGPGRPKSSTHGTKQDAEESSRLSPAPVRPRSEERRVGKECRKRGAEGNERHRAMDATLK